MKRTSVLHSALLGLLLPGFWCAPPNAIAADWPQFMRGPEHAGEATEETLRLPLGLATCVKLDDAVTTSPAVVGGRVYVVDQMGTAYCIDPKANRVLWKSAPEGKLACGSNTSSPCVVKGRLYYGTTAGRLHILNAADGKVQKRIDVGWPITGSPTFANDSIYFQDLGAIVHCLDLNGNERWRWDHYKQYVDPKTNKRASQSCAPMYCISAKDGKLKWQADRVSYSHHPALGEDYLVVRGYGGYGWVRELATGKPLIRDKREVDGGCPDHACSPVLLTSGRLSYAVSSSGLYVREMDSGKIVWQSLGFAPRACNTPTAANGRLFFSPNVNNMLYCFEPVSETKK